MNMYKIKFIKRKKDRNFKNIKSQKKYKIRIFQTEEMKIFSLYKILKRQNKYKYFLKKTRYVSL